MVFAATLLALVLGQAPPGSGRPDVDLLNAARSGDLPRARDLVTGGVAANVADWRGYTPLMWAAAAGHLEMTRFFLESGALVDARAADGNTALMLASANGMAEVVRLLLARGANPSVVRNGMTPRQLAAARGAADVAALLERAETLGAQLLQAAGDGQAMTVRQLLASGAPSNVTNTDGVSALMLSARNGDLGTMQFLLSRGADTTNRDAKGQGVFEWAERQPTTRQYVGAFLRERGIKPDARPAVPRPAPAVTASLQALDALLKKIAPSGAAARAAHKRSTTALAELSALSASWPAQSPEDYRTNLSAEVAAVGSAVARADQGLMRQTLEALADDLEAKLDHCRKSGGKLGGSVLVRVRTVQGADEARRWQVLYLPRIREVLPDAVPDLFPQLSSPTEELLVPGRYVMWPRNPATGKLGERTIVKVGEGRKELVVDLPVPSDGK